jgi:hypothetical protein
MGREVPLNDLRSHPTLVKASQDAVLSALTTIEPGLTYEWRLPITPDHYSYTCTPRSLLTFLRVCWAP